jgi:hypothetical protein
MTYVPVLSAAGLIVALSAPLGCAAYISAVVVDHVQNGSAKPTCLVIVGLVRGGATQPKKHFLATASVLAGNARAAG